MTPLPLTPAERQEAESIKYGAAVFMLIPLTSGRFAAMNAGRSIFGAYAPTSCLEEIEIPQPEVRRYSGRLVEVPPKADPDLDLEIEL